MDTIRTLLVATGAVSFIQFALQVLALPEVSSKDSAPDLEKKLLALGVQYQGKPVSRFIANNILSIVGMAVRSMGLRAVRFLEHDEKMLLSRSNEYPSWHANHRETLPGGGT